MSPARCHAQRPGAPGREKPWKPAERLAEFNAHIVGSIEVIATFTS